MAAGTGRNTRTGVAGTTASKSRTRTAQGGHTMKKQDINRIYTEKVAELLARGYQINTETTDAHGAVCR